jgi:hypothetical protein
VRRIRTEQRPQVLALNQAATFSSSTDVCVALAGMPFFHGKSTG